MRMFEPEEGRTDRMIPNIEHTGGSIRLCLACKIFYPLFSGAGQTEKEKYHMTFLIC